MFAAKLASVPQRSEILALKETLDQWKCFIVMQDRLLALENPSLKVREAAVQLQRKTEALMDSYRLLAATILEERA